MSENVKIVRLDDYQLAYEVYGDGDTNILCFHGNSRSAEDFKFLARPNRKVISIHLFLHQYSTFSAHRIEDGSVHLDDVEKLLRKILENEKVEQFHWCAYSQGGLFSLSLFPLFAAHVKSFYLIAPDGLNNNSFYSRTQHQRWAQKLFKRWVKKPHELENVIKFLVKIKVLHPKMIEFIEFYTSDTRVLKMAHDTWKGFRNIRPDYQKIKETLDHFPDIRFNLIIGQFDKIITVKSAQRFLKKIGKDDRLLIIPHGHNVFKPEIQKELFYILEMK